MRPGYVPTVKVLRKAALGRRLAIKANCYQARHSAPERVTYERTAWHAAAPRSAATALSHLASGLMSGARAISHALTHLKAAKPVRPPVLTPEPLPAGMMPMPVSVQLSRPRGAHRATGRAARFIGHRAPRQAAPVRLSQRQQEALTRTEELVLKGCHAIRRHAEDVGKRRGMHLIPEVWSIA